jgi:1,4-dihydroxy-6-naphthoate synthase
LVVKRSLPDEVKQKVNRLIRKSVEFAFENPKSALPFIKQHAQEMKESVIYQHVDLYVNKYSIDLGEEGKKAIQIMFDQAFDKKIIPNAIDTDLFLNN